MISVPCRKSEKWPPEKEKYCHKGVYDPTGSLVAGNSVSIEWVCKSQSINIPLKRKRKKFTAGN